MGMASLHKLVQEMSCDYAAVFVGIDLPHSSPFNPAEEFATLRTSRVIQSIDDLRVRKCFIDLGREIGRRGGKESRD